MSRSDIPPASSAAVSTALQAAERAGIERLDAQWLLCDLLGKNRSWLITDAGTPLNPDQWQAWLKLLDRHADGEPLGYLLGRQSFFGLTLQVGPAVLVPRSDTETLVRWAAEILRQRDAAAPTRVIDLGCGSGAIALALKSVQPAAEVTAVDLSSEALQVAAANGARLGLPIEWCNGDWWAAVGARRFDLAVSNPPYVATDDPHLADLQHEPTLALVSGDDGLCALRDIIAQASRHLNPQSWLLLEHGHQQADAVSALLLGSGFEAIESRHDLAGRTRCTGGRRP